MFWRVGAFTVKRPSFTWPPRILHVIDTLNLGGAERMAVELANAAYSRGWPVAIIATRESGLMQAHLRNEIPCVALGRKSRFDLRFLDRLRIFEREFQPSLLHIHGLSSAVFVAGARLCGQLHCPSLLHEHFSNIHKSNRPDPLFRMTVGWYVKKVVGVSRKNAEWAVRSGFPRDMVVHIHNALDTARVRDEQKANLEIEFPDRIQRPCGIVIGRLDPQKGIMTFLEAVARLPREAHWSFLLVGGGAETPYGRQCLQRADALGLCDRVILTGPRADPVRLAKACDFAVIPSHSESGPLVLIEYLTCEVPVIATQVGENTAMAREARAIICVPPADADALAAAMKEMITMTPEQRADMGRTGWKRTRGLFDMGKVFPRWEETYRQVLGH